MFRRRNTALPFVLLCLLFTTAAPAGAQTCNDQGAYCEGWSRDSTRREISLTRNTICSLTFPNTCPATCTTSPITALPSVRVGDLNHVVLGFSVPDACVPGCPGAVNPEPCYNLGISYRYTLSGGSESVSGVYDCDPLGDPGTFVSAGATFTGTYASGGVQTVTVTNIDYGLLPPPDDCGSAPTSLDISATGPDLDVQSRFTFTWTVNASTGQQQVTGYTEKRTYRALAGPNNVVDITVTNIDYNARTFQASAPNASTPARGTTWGQLKVRYR